MGNEESKGQEAVRSTQKSEQEEYFILDELNKMSVKGGRVSKYFWIDPNIISNENSKYKAYLKNHLNLTALSSVQSMYQEIMDVEPDHVIKVIAAASLKEEEYERIQKDPLIKTIYLFCQNQEKAKLLLQNFPKITFAKYQVTDLKEAIIQAENKESEANQSKTVLFMNESDINLQNKYRLNYYCLTSHGTRSKSKDDFLELMFKLYPEQKAEIENMRTSYNLQLLGEPRYSQTLKWVFKDNFFWNSTQNIPKNSIDPKKLAYLRLPVKDIFESVFESYKSMPKDLDEAYLVLELNNEEIASFEKNDRNFITFTTFVKAFENEAEAREFQETNENNVLFIVNLSKAAKEKKLDFGYFYNKESKGANIIFNIYNFFRIEGVDMDIKEVNLVYGSLAELVYKRDSGNLRFDKFEKNQGRLLRNYDYVEELMRNITGQETVLQMSGQLRESLKVYERKMDHVRKTLSKDEVDRHTIEMGDAYRINEEYKKAEVEYEKVINGGGYMKIVGMVHLAELHFKLGREKELNQLLPEIEKGIPLLEDKNPPESFKALNFIGMSLTSQDRLKEAAKLFENLYDKASKYYNFKHEAIPIVHEISKNYAACRTKRNQFSEALNLLNSTKGWEENCEGNLSPNLLRTENLIRSIHVSQGNLSEIKKSEIELTRIQESMLPEDYIYVKSSSMMPNSLQESNFFINTSSNQMNIGDSGNIKESNINIEI